MVWQQTAGLSGRFKAISASLSWRHHMFHLAHQQLYFPMILLQKGSTKGGGEGRAAVYPLSTFLWFQMHLGCVGWGGQQLTLRSLLFSKDQTARAPLTRDPEKWEGNGIRIFQKTQIKCRHQTPWEEGAEEPRQPEFGARLLLRFCQFFLPVAPFPSKLYQAGSRRERRGGWGGGPTGDFYPCV